MMAESLMVLKALRVESLVAELTPISQDRAIFLPMVVNKARMGQSSEPTISSTSH